METQKMILEKLERLENAIINQSVSQKSTLSFREACIYLQVSASYLYKLTSAKRIPHFCPGGKKIYFNRLELDNWLNSSKRCTAKQKLIRTFQQIGIVLARSLPTIINAAIKILLAHI